MAPGHHHSRIVSPGIANGRRRSQFRVNPLVEVYFAIFRPTERNIVAERTDIWLAAVLGPGECLVS